MKETRGKRKTARKRSDEGHGRRATRRRDETARNEVPEGARALGRDSKHEASFDLPSLPVDRTAPPNSQLALSASPPLLPLSSVKLPHTVVVDCFRCNYNFDLGGPSSDIIINYCAGAARRRHSRECAAKCGAGDKRAGVRLSEAM